MKFFNQFVNVLYRRILYRIPLKFLLILLAVVSVFIACFSSALTLDMSNYSSDDFEYHKYNNVNGTIDISPSKPGFTCIYVDSGNPSASLYDGVDTFYFSNWNVICTNSNTVILNFNNTYSYFRYYFTTTLLKEFYPDYSSLQCQTEYNLIPISSVDQNYCTTNNLCPAQYTESQCKSVYGLIDESECTGGGSCPVGSGGVSTLYINDILHVASPFINMTIPQEIGWDYEYTQGGTNMNIDIEGYNVDYDKIENIVNTQSYTPDEYDLNSIITDIVPLFVPGLVIILFLYFLFIFIKKIF